MKCSIIINGGGWRGECNRAKQLSAVRDILALQGVQHSIPDKHKHSNIETKTKNSTETKAHENKNTKAARSNRKPFV